MKLIYLILTCLLLDSSLVTAGLLDAIDDLLLGTGGSQRPSRIRERPKYQFNSNEQSNENSDVNSNDDDRRNGLLSSLLSNRPNNFNNNIPNNGQITLNNLSPSNRPNNFNNNLPNNGQITLNNLLPSNRPNNFNDNLPLNNGQITLNNHLPSNTPNYLNNNNLNGLGPNNNNQEDQDKLVAEAFPEGVALLDRLKEMNKLKAEGKLNIGLTNNNNKTPTYPLVTVPPQYPTPTRKPYIPTPKPYEPTPKPYEPTPKPYAPTPTSYAPTPKPYKPTPKPYEATPNSYEPTAKPYVPTPTTYEPMPKPNGEQSNSGNNDNATTEEPNAVEVKDFYFQAQPVVPDNERNGTFPLYIVE